MKPVNPNAGMHNAGLLSILPREKRAESASLWGFCLTLALNSNRYWFQRWPHANPASV